jgi:hypothetical protein
MSAIPDISAFCDADTRRLAARALEKKRTGKRASIDETRALRRFEKAAEEQKRWEHYGSIPKKHWQEMSGRQPKVLNEQASRYGIPLRGKSIDLSAVAAWVHDFLAANAAKLNSDDDTTGEELKKWKAKREKLKYETEIGNLVPRDEVHAGLAIVARHLRTAGEWLGKHAGREAQERLERALDNAQAALDRHFDRSGNHDKRRAG